MKRLDRRMDELREKIGVKMSLMVTLVKCLPAEVGWAFVADVGRENDKESRYSEGER